MSGAELDVSVTQINATGREAKGVPEVYHRKKSPTQTDADADLQIKTQKICGTVGRFSYVPTARAYTGPLPPNEDGVQFETDVVPSSVVPFRKIGVISTVLWREGDPGVTSDGTLACIPVTNIWKRP